MQKLAKCVQQAQVLQTQGQGQRKLKGEYYGSYTPTLGSSSVPSVVPTFGVHGHVSGKPDPSLSIMSQEEWEQKKESKPEISPMPLPEGTETVVFEYNATSQKLDLVSDEVELDKSTPEKSQLRGGHGRVLQSGTYSVGSSGNTVIQSVGSSRSVSSSSGTYSVRSSGNTVIQSVGSSSVSSSVSSSSGQQNIIKGSKGLTQSTRANLEFRVNGETYNVHIDQCTKSMTVKYGTNECSGVYDQSITQGKALNLIYELKSQGDGNSNQVKFWLGPLGSSASHSIHDDDKDLLMRDVGQWIQKTRAQQMKQQQDNKLEENQQLVFQNIGGQVECKLQQEGKTTSEETRYSEASRNQDRSSNQNTYSQQRPLQVRNWNTLLQQMCSQLVFAGQGGAY